jgi:hypothetical protein
MAGTVGLHLFRPGHVLGVVDLARAGELGLAHRCRADQHGAQRVGRRPVERRVTGYWWSARIPTVRYSCLCDSR